MTTPESSRHSYRDVLSIGEQIRFWGHVQRGNDLQCWPWIGERSPKGYGYFTYFRFGRRVRALCHRVAWELTRARIGDGLQLDHLCRNAGCANPSHLEAVTSRINTLRGVSVAAQHAKRTHCSHGHELSGDNLGPNKRWRDCLICKRARAAASQRRLRTHRPERLKR